MTDKSKVLQLLLIIDFMADWARDYYREMIKKGLKTLKDSSLNELSDLQLKDIDSQESDILSKTNSRTPDTITNHSFGNLGIDHDQSGSVLSENDQIPSSTGVLLHPNAFIGSNQMPYQPQLQQSVSNLVGGISCQGMPQSHSELQTPIYDPSMVPGNSDLLSGTTYVETWQRAPELLLSSFDNNSYLGGISHRGIPQSLSEPQTPTYDPSMAPRNPNQLSGISYIETRQRAPEPLPSLFNDNPYPQIGNPYLPVGTPNPPVGNPDALVGNSYPQFHQFSYQTQSSQSIDNMNNFLLPETSPFSTVPQSAPQSDPPRDWSKLPSARIQHFGATQAVQQSQPESYSAHIRQSDLPFRVGPMRTPRPRFQRRGDEYPKSRRGRSESPKARVSLDTRKIHSERD